MRRFRLTRRAATMLLVGGTLVLAGATAQAGWLFVIAAGVLGVVAASPFVPRRLSGVAVERAAPRLVTLGEPVGVGLTCTNRGRRTLPLVRIRDSTDAFDTVALLCDGLAPGASAHIETQRVALRRGVYSSGEVAVESGWPFGLVRSARTLALPADVTVVPRWVELNSFPLLEPSSYPEEFLHQRARAGAGLEFAGVRDYRPGDPVHTIDWRSVARTGRLIVRELEQETGSHVALVIAGPDVGEPPDSAFEMLVSAAASVATYALKTGHPVELIAAHTSIGKVDQRGMLKWLATLEASEEPLLPLVDEAAGRIGRRGTIVLLMVDAGRTRGELAVAVAAAESAGLRAITVRADGSTWVDRAVEGMTPRGATGRVLTKGKELRSCLEG